MLKRIKDFIASALWVFCPHYNVRQETVVNTAGNHKWLSEALVCKDCGNIVAI